VGQYDRAEVIIRKMAQTRCDTSILREANNTFLRALVNALANQAEGVTVPRVQKWVEVEMPQLDLTPDSTTLALVCRSLFTQNNIHYRERMCRRYLYMAERMGLLDATLASGEYTAHEWNELCRIRADIFEQLPEAEEILPSPQLKTKLSNSAIKPTLQRGLGLSTLTKGLRSLTLPNRTSTEVSEEDLEQWQLQLENEMIDAEVERWQVEHANMLKMGINPALSKKSMEATLWYWKTQLEEQIKLYITTLQQNPKAWTRNYGQFLEQIPVDKLAAITIMGTLTVIHRAGIEQGAPSKQVIDHIGTCLELETMGQVHNKLKRNASVRRANSQIRILKIAQRLQSKSTPKPADVEEGKQRFLQSAQIEWNEPARVKISALLLSKFIEVALYPESESGAKSNKKSEDITRLPALSHQVIHVQGKRRGMIYVSKSFREKLIGEPPMYQSNATQLPMISKPEPWDDFKGAYLRSPATVMRVKDSYGLQDVYIHAAIENGDIKQVLGALNVLGQTPWRINERLLQVMIDVWNTGKPLTNFPPANPVMEYPPEPTDDADPMLKRKWRNTIRDLNNLKSGYQSNRCYINQQLEVANAYIGYDIYFPHNLDWRGRAYPVPGILNHMGADNARALFMFAKGKELGNEGLDWLKVHLANTFGFDKASLEDRRHFAVDHLKEIRDSVEKPLDGERWWMKAEDPWQCLATSMELISALDSPDPSKFVSHIPVHQDGTCNGLQHYAALGGDILGAAQVNLVPREKPADIYSEVAKLVEHETEKDAANGNLMAKALSGLISRKVVKQPVMTNVYGVTFIGALEQVKKRLDEIIPPNANAEFSNRQLASYIASNIFKVLGNMFAGATQIQFWLAECAGIISSSVSPEQIEKARILLEGKQIKTKKSKRTTVKPLELQSAVIWTTPMKLPVVQPYRKLSKRNITTSLQHIYMKAPNAAVTVLKRKQMAGFPPNFIHSLDATHMMLSALKCNELGLSFASVHDSFWTHACDIPTMNSVLRNAFVHMHSEDIIQRLAAEFCERYKNFLCVKLVPSNSKLGQKIKLWRRKNVGRGGTVKGLPSLRELTAEYDRLRFLKSDNPEERAKGEKMVTPGSLFSAVKPESTDMEIEVDTTLPLSEQLRVVEKFAVATTDAAVSQPGQNITADSVEAGDAGAKAEAPKKKPARKPNMLKIWAATTFPPLPKRGDFDVAMLKKSE
jgi:DNA-directed RNA polymerase, mitochondrial